ncbi:alpha/beta hydrolase [Clostridium sp.]|uniref:alpha/beta hydrolase n=1 Tax=Clostridium sp. TaxID=1506 RepID=UPI00260224F7|nr:alpha/beta hydrolase [Clostridium sp.]
MEFKESYMTMRDGEKLYINKSIPRKEEEPVGVICIVHGSCEYSKRYNHFISYLVSNGYIVYSYDLRGHGLSNKENETLGYFGESNGWNKLIYDLDEIINLIKNENEKLNLYLLGHSMGSFIVRHYSSMFSKKIDGIIATGTAHNSRLILRTGKLLAEIDIKKNGSKHRNKLLNKISYDSFSNKFKPIRTKQDWLTRDEKIVDEYIEDNLCGFIFTSDAFKDMFEGLLFITDKDNIENTRKNLPILLLSGGSDPVGDNGKMVKQSYKEYKKCGIINIEMKLYKGMRHEILNEIGKEEVYKDILIWINNNNNNNNEKTEEVL